MVLEAVSHLVSRQGIERYVTPLVSLAGAYTLRSWCAGYVCREDRNLNNKTIILVGGFSGAGLALFQSLAARGAQVIALHPSPATPTILQLVLLLRETSGNERLYADECDMADMGSIRSFVKRWEKDARGGMVQDLEARIEAVVFCNGEGAGLEGQGIGLGRQTVDDAGTLERYHSSLLLSRHCLVQLLLPTLLRSATHSPVRIVNQVSPFYAARPLNLSDLDYSTRKYPTRQPWLAEGQSSLGSIALFRELQARVNESKNSGAGLAIVSVCGGFTRSTFRHALRADSRQPHFSWVGFLVYCALFPFIFLFAKSAAEASEGLLAAVLGSVKRADVPVVLGEAVEEDRPKIDVDGKVRKGQGEKEREPMRVRGGAVYREGREVRIKYLEDAPPTLPTELWEIESKRVESLVALAVQAEEAASKAKKTAAPAAASEQDQESTRTKDD